ncbi:hypothetical protein PISL3812_02456 [Talaromyces islandicus]|uniref:Uncharacterized protein n=1 Tax=Talaromyces islandicus TaxID=28573 RepID=A0A0U1LPY9_TALIS|nr:hypothetical protein PISL3812_02456 [Talaromyces islandicus]
MTLFRGHFPRRASSQAQKAGVDSTTQPSKSVSPGKRPPDTGPDIELREIFRQAVDTTANSAQNAPPPKSQTSLLQRLVRRREDSTGLDRLTDNANQALHQDAREEERMEVLSTDPATKTRSQTPDLVSDGGYDSDAQFIASPRFSSQSWESLSALGLHHTDGTSASSRVLAGPEDRVKTLLSDIDPIPLPSFERRRLPSLALPKRRTAIDSLTSSKYSFSLRTSSSLHQSHEVHASHAKENTPMATSDSETKSKFTELFNHGKQEATGPRDPSRRISIGWMSEGKRYGYGYSFVESEEADVIVLSDSKDIKGTTTTKDDSPVCETQQAQEKRAADVKIPHEKAVELPSVSLGITTDTSRKHSWSSLPSHSKEERNHQCAGFEDGVIVRDFCTNASPDSEQPHTEEKERRLISGAIRQGISDAMLCVFGLGKREIARYHAGLDIKAARQYHHQDPQFETAVPSRSYVPKEELGDHHIEAWRVARRRSKQRRASTMSQPVVITSGAKVQRSKRDVKSGSNVSFGAYSEENNDGFQLSTLAHSFVKEKVH